MIRAKSGVLQLCIPRSWLVLLRRFDCLYKMYTTYLFDLCLLSNVSMLAIKCIYACCQMYICLLSNTKNCCIDVAVASLKI